MIDSKKVFNKLIRKMKKNNDLREITDISIPELGSRLDKLEQHGYKITEACIGGNNGHFIVIRLRNNNNTLAEIRDDDLPSLQRTFNRLKGKGWRWTSFLLSNDQKPRVQLIFQK